MLGNITVSLLVDLGYEGEEDKELKDKCQGYIQWISR